MAGTDVVARVRARAHDFVDARGALACVTTLAALVIAATGVFDLVSGSVNVASWWTWLCVVLALSAAGIPVLLGRRFPPAIGFAACGFFAIVTVWQVAESTGTVMLINNLVLYPMVSCYLGWFYARWAARALVGAMFIASGIAVLQTSSGQVFTTWINLALASMFCLEAAAFLRLRLNRQIETDSLTGVLNRIGLDRCVARELARSGRTGADLSLAIVDLDDFKNVNDTLGHLLGDRLLQQVATHLREGTRPYDAIARFGGDEFVVVMPSVPIAAAENAMHRLCDTAPTAWSYGIATSQPTDTIETLLGRADLALYEKKSQRS